jgi:uncharacterized membrane protein YbhN (UPF0104 family)
LTRVPSPTRRLADSPSLPVSPSPLLPVPTLRLAMLVCSLWAVGVVTFTTIGLVLEASRSGWHGLAAPANVLPAMLFAVGSYLGRFLRWHVLARRVAPTLEVGSSFVISAIGFSLAMTPGRMGEALKLLLLRQRSAVPVATSASVLFLERASEGLGFLLLAVVASLFLPWTEALQQSPNILILVGALLALGVGVTFRRPIMMAACSRAPLAKRLPGARRFFDRPGLQQLGSNLTHGGDRVLGWPGVLIALLLSLAARLCDGLAIFWVARAFGIELSLAAAWFIIGSAGFIGGLTMLPGGAGAVEATMVGLLLAFGGGAAAAFATVLTSRVLIFWTWVALGLLLALRYSMSSDGRRTSDAGSNPMPDAHRPVSASLHRPVAPTADVRRPTSDST